MHNSEGGGRASSLSKRRSNLIRKAQEICFFGDADVAFVAFSPCGRLTKFSSKKRIEDILQKYVDLPAGQRYKHLKDVDQGKIMKLRELKHIEGEDNKVHYLSNQIHHLELQIKKAQVDIEILDANLRDYELHPEQQSDHSLPQLLWCEKNLNRELQRVLHRKNYLTGSNCSSPYHGCPFMARRDVVERGNLGSVSSPFSSYAGEELTRPNQSMSYSQLIMKLDPWISPYSPKVRDTIIRDILTGPSPDHNGTTSEHFEESSSRPVTQTCPFDVLYNTSPPLEKNIPDCHLSHRPFIPTPMNVTSGDNSNTNFDVGNYGDGPNTKYSAAAPKNPTPEDPPLLHGVSSEDEVGNGGFGSGTNQEFGSPDWDGFLLADNLNFDDLDIVF